MKHKHHIIPKHMGGTDDPSNLVELTIEEHADAHKKLWEEHGRVQDWLAWQGLSGLMTKEEIVKMQLSAAGKKGVAVRGPVSVDAAKKGGKAVWEKHKDAITKTLQKNARKNKEMKEKTGRGVGGQPVGKYQWITDGNVNKKVSINATIPEGFSRGRTRQR